LGEKMSHLRICSISIKQFNKNIAKKSMELLAQFLKGEIVTKVEDYYGVKYSVLIGVKAPNIRGFGIRITKDGLQVVGDDYAQTMKLWQLRDLFQQFYTSTAVQFALLKLGYQVGQYVQKDGNILVRGVRLRGYVV